MADELVAQALASGEWKERTDTNSGKKYYFNTKMNKTVWERDLVKEMRKQNQQVFGERGGI